MKKQMTRAMFAVAALAVAAVSASAQTYTVKVPMAFKMGDKRMAPGPYRIQVLNSRTGKYTLVFHNVATARNVIAGTLPGDAPSEAWQKAGNAVLAFQCAASACSLSRVWDGVNSITYDLLPHQTRPAEVERVSSFVLPLTRAD